MGENSADGEFHQLFISNDDIIEGYLVTEKIDEGNFGQVFKVSKDTKRYAMKIEPGRLDGGAAALLTEVDIMMSLTKQKVKYFPKLVYYKSTPTCHILVMDLLGDNLKSLRLKCPNPNVSSSGTWSRIGIQCLYVLKQMHDNGYVHLDIKPGNFAMGPPDDILSSRVLHLLDFGISREFVRQKKGTTSKSPGVNLQFRPQKKKVTSVVGTPVYASPNAHAFKDVGRNDDVWSLLYMIAEMISPLPWHSYEDKELENRKLKCKLKDLYKNDSFDAVETMLLSSTYSSFPNYELVYKIFKDVYDKSRTTWLDPYDWETKQMASYARWKELVDNRSTLFPWEYSNIVSFFREDRYSNLKETKNEKRRERKKVDGDPTTMTAEAPTVEEAKTPRPVMKKTPKPELIKSKPKNSKTKKSHRK